MSALPPTASRIAVETELAGARAWAERHGWELQWDPEPISIRVPLLHPNTGATLELLALCDGYRGWPPAWTFVRPGTADVERAYFPSPGPGSIFHSKVVICAPWNRLAYKEVHEHGPHDNWGGPAAWLQVAEGPRAETIGDMLAMIDLHLAQSPGVMG